MTDTTPSTLTLTERQVRALARQSQTAGRFYLADDTMLTYDEMADLRRRFTDFLSPLADAPIEVKVG